MIDISSAAVIVVHGGAGGNPKDADGCASAAALAARILENGGAALDGAVAAVAALEDDGRFNAGSGAIVGLDGVTIEMDASVMDSVGQLGSVACIRRVKNPVLVARDVAASPHRMLCGEGATSFARVGGHADFYRPTEKSFAANRAIAAALAPDPGPFGMLWNYASNPLEPARHACDTVGAVVRAPDGQFAVAASTGGNAPALLGRVGDAPLVGSGFYAGKRGAVTVTGIGDKIIPHLLAYSVYLWLAEGAALDQALQRGLDLFDADENIGIIAINPTHAGAAWKHCMPFAFK